MWLSEKFVELFKIPQEMVLGLREENASLKAENAALKSDLLTTKANFAWLTTRVNSLEFQNTALLEKAYNIKVPAPQLVQVPREDPGINPRDFSFDDLGDDLAKKLGLPLHNE